MKRAVGPVPKFLGICVTRHTQFAPPPKKKRERIFGNYTIFNILAYLGAIVLVKSYKKPIQIYTAKKKVIT